MSAILAQPVDTSQWSIIAINGSPYGQVGYAQPIVYDDATKQICAYSITQRPSILWTPAVEVGWLAEVRRITKLDSAIPFPEAGLSQHLVLAWFSEFASRYFNISQPTRKLVETTDEPEQSVRGAKNLRIACYTHENLEDLYAQVSDRVRLEFDTKLKLLNEQTEEIVNLAELGVQVSRQPENNYQAAIRRLVLLCLWNPKLVMQYYFLYVNRIHQFELAKVIEDVYQIDEKAGIEFGKQMQENALIGMEVTDTTKSSKPRS